MDMVKEAIIGALNKDINLSTEEYAEKNRQADKATENNGIKKQGKGRVPVVNEELRHKRVQTNFYGTVLNLLLNICISLEEVKDELKVLNGTNEEDDIKEVKVENNE